MRNAQHVWGLPFGDRAVLDFEAGASQIEVLPLEPGAAPRIEAGHLAVPLQIVSVGEVVRVRPGVLEMGRMRSGRGLLEGAVSMIIDAAAAGGEFRLHLPPTVKLRLAANMGQAKIRGLTCCDLDVETSAGQVQLEGCRGRFVLKAKAGQIVGRRLGGTFHIESGAGEAVLDIVQLDAGEHRVHSTMGSVKIDLAPGLDVRIESRTVMGSTRTKYPSRSDAPAVLKLEAELGSVRVREGERYDDPRRGDWPDWKKVWKVERAPPPKAPADDDALRSILAMVEQKKISAEEAERLIAAL